MLHNTHFPFTTCFSLSLSRSRSPSVSLSLCVCQMVFMYLIYFGERATVETKTLRHILLARTLFKKQIHTCSLQAHTYPHTHTHLQVHALAQEFCRYCVWHNWFILLILYSLIQYLQKIVFRNYIKNALFSYCHHIIITSYILTQCSGFGMDFRNLGDITFAWLEDGDSVDAQR